MRNEIILIGPMLAGKSSMALILADHFEFPIINIDQIKWKYLAEYGLTQSHAENLLINYGVNEMINFYKPYESLIVEKILSNYKKCIFDFGAGFSIYDDVFLQNKINKILFEYKNIFLILPSENMSLNKRILGERLKIKIKNDPFLTKHYHALYNLCMYFLDHPTNNTLAKHILYTHGVSKTKLIQQVIKKIL